MPHALSVTLQAVPPASTTENARHYTLRGEDFAEHDRTEGPHPLSGLRADMWQNIAHRPVLHFSRGCTNRGVTTR